MGELGVAFFHLWIVDIQGGRSHNNHYDGKIRKIW